MNWQELVGMTEGAALAKIQKAGFQARVRERDGEHFMGTCDYRTDRVNLRISKGKITAAYVG